MSEPLLYPEPSPVFVAGRDEITGDEYDGVLRVEMSCGHAVDPGTLTSWCRSLLDQGHTTFHCPAVRGVMKCGAQWPYTEVRRHASLSEEEQNSFEQKLAITAAQKYCDFKQCPGCKSLVERKDLTNLRVLCIICQVKRGKQFEFCWQCLKPWTGAGTPSDKCADPGCRNVKVDTLANCSLKDLPGSEIKNCPSIRACPTCGQLIEHSEKCKYILCNQCQVEFCFACLDSAANCRARKPGAWFKYCAKPLAPRQTKIPVWSQRK
ncbi:probable E3 ubiquitin-protein ligase RNF217 [Ornithorhynchus anatinus]|uniref:RING-type domain-containing protein n=1 Tax=Ornithorhynchus anatinus TaxID=9258 RepID=A0A6I8N717_ORNAN|nr:probable E3 ubiquitin-protein ligase RNF217 [Ornithorhynchus anatinus]